MGPTKTKAEDGFATVPYGNSPEIIKRAVSYFKTLQYCFDGIDSIKFVGKIPSGVFLDVTLK
jgi:hypothetical protein